MSRGNATNYTKEGCAFPKATEASDPFKKEDVQVLAEAVDQHDHTNTLGAPLGANTVDTSQIKDGALAASAAGRAKMADGFLSADATGRAKMANDFVDLTKIGNQVVGLLARQGGSATDWTTAGTTTYTPTAVREQVGVWGGSFTDETGLVFTTTTFPVAFSQPPNVTITIECTTLGTLVVGMPASVTASQFTLQVARSSTTGSLDFVAHWRAIGPE